MAQRVSNNSWSVPQSSDPGGALASAMQYVATKAFPGQGTGVVFTAAAGNDSQDIDIAGQEHWPANYSTAYPNVLAVAATYATGSQAGSLTQESDWGPTSVQVAAPGWDIEGADLGTGYEEWSGTSQATPFVSGVAALLLQENPGWSASQVVSQIENTVAPDASLSGKIVTGGIIDAGAALEDLNWTGGSLTGPASVNSGASFTVTRSYNIAGGPVLNNFTIAYYAYSQPTLDTSKATLLATETINTAAGLTTGLHTGTSPNLQITQLGAQYLFAVLDSGNTVFETNETNNIGSAPITVTSASGQSQSVDLSGAYDVGGIVTDGSTFGNHDGFDGSGQALSQEAGSLGAPVVWNGVSFTPGPANANDVVGGHGQVISLPSGTYSTLNLLGAAVWGDYTNVPFIVTYADNSTQTIDQSISEWDTPQGYPNESTVVTMPYLDLYNGTEKTTETVHLYAYSFALESGHGAAVSVTLPQNNHVNVVAMTLE